LRNQLSRAQVTRGSYAGKFAQGGEYEHLTPHFDGAALAAVGGAINASGLALGSYAELYYQPRVSANGAALDLGMTRYTNAMPGRLQNLRVAGGYVASAGVGLDAYSFGTAVINQDGSTALLSGGNIGTGFTAAIWGGPPGLAIAGGQFLINASLSGYQAYTSYQNFRGELAAANSAAAVINTADRTIDRLSKEMAEKGCN